MRLIDADALNEYLGHAEIEATKNRKYVFASALNTIRANLANAPTIELQIIHCKDCKHRNTEECPMRYEEWVSRDYDGYIESDIVVHDRTLDDGFCDRGERCEEDEG